MLTPDEQTAFSSWLTENAGKYGINDASSVTYDTAPDLLNASWSQSLSNGNTKNILIGNDGTVLFDPEAYSYSSAFDGTDSSATSADATGSTAETQTIGDKTYTRGTSTNGTDTWTDQDGNVLNGCQKAARELADRFGYDPETFGQARTMYGDATGDGGIGKSGGGYGSGANGDSSGQNGGWGR